MQAILAEEYCSVQTPQPTAAAVSDLPWQAASQQNYQSENSSQLAAGLQNSAGEFNCFLNVIIQCLWYCSCFRTAVMAWPPSVYQVWHVHLQTVSLEACTPGVCIWGLYLGIFDVCLGSVGIQGLLFASTEKLISGHRHDHHHNFRCYCCCRHENTGVYCCDEG